MTKDLMKAVEEVLRKLKYNMSKSYSNKSEIIRPKNVQVGKTKRCAIFSCEM